MRHFLFHENKITKCNVQGDRQLFCMYQSVYWAVKYKTVTLIPDHIQRGQIPVDNLDLMYITFNLGNYQREITHFLKLESVICLIKIVIITNNWIFDWIKAKELNIQTYKNILYTYIYLFESEKLQINTNLFQDTVFHN